MIILLNKSRFVLSIFFCSLILSTLQPVFAATPSDITALDAENDNNNGFTNLSTPNGVDTFTIGSSTYAIVVSSSDNGVQIINISNPAAITATDAETDGTNSFAELDVAFGVDTFTIGSSTYAIVAAVGDDGVQIINISDPTNITATDAETDGTNSFAELDGAFSVDTFTIGSSTYAIVASEADDGVQIINITDPTNITATDAETDGATFTELDGAYGVETVTIGSSTYAIVASDTDDGVQIINITDPTNITATDAETDGANGFTMLDGARNLSIFTISGSTYTIVTSEADNGVQMIILNTFSPPPAIEGGGGNSDATSPTLGLDANSKRLITDGFTYNGKPVNVELYYTPYPLITTNIGYNNTAEFKIYENSGHDKIRHFDFAFGLAKGLILSDSKARIEWNKTWDDKETITLVDPNNVLQNVTISSNTISCQESSNDQCLLLVIYHTFRAPLDFDIVATNVWDEKRNAWQNYYNHGIEIVGESLNPPKEYDGINQGHIYHLTETGKNITVDEFGNSWSFKYDTWIMDYVLPDKIQDAPVMVMTRTHSDFAKYQNDQADYAIASLLEFCPVCLKSFDDFAPSKTIAYSERMNKLDDPEIQKKMAFESERAQKTMANLLDPSSHHQ